MLFPDITYSFYPVWAQLFGLDCETVPLDAGMCVRVEDYRREAGSIVIANPNAPTGGALPRAEIARLLQDHPDIPVLIDEAYVDFSGESALPLIAELCAWRRRADRGAATRERQLQRLPAGPPRPGGRDGFRSRRSNFRESCARVVAGREAMTRELIRLGFVILPSSANFVFASHPARGGSEFAAALREHSVLARHLNKPRTAPYLRITVGTEDDTGRLIATAADILGG